MNITACYLIGLAAFILILCVMTNFTKSSEGFQNQQMEPVDFMKKGINKDLVDRILKPETSDGVRFISCEKLRTYMENDLKPTSQGENSEQKAARDKLNTALSKCR